MSQGQLDEIYERAQALLSSGDYRSAFIELEKIALKGHIPAMSMMGYLYEVGKGTEPDIYKAVEWYKKSAEGGSNTAQYNLASCYKNGKGVKKDLCEAVRWFTASAEQGNTRAQYTLAYRHLN
ncbi:MAG: sel1 repeat family protein [Clostridia bacterium]|nr:sel1 repeat family protein [Clostridia bacterium]